MVTPFALLCMSKLPAHPLRPFRAARPKEEEEIAPVDIAKQHRLPLGASGNREYIVKIRHTRCFEGLGAMGDFLQVLSGVRQESHRESTCFADRQRLLRLPTPRCLDDSHAEPNPPDRNCTDPDADDPKCIARWIVARYCDPESNACRSSLPLEGLQSLVDLGSAHGEFEFDLGATLDPDLEAGEAPPARLLVE